MFALLFSLLNPLREPNFQIPCPHSLWNHVSEIYQNYGPSLFSVSTSGHFSSPQQFARSTLPPSSGRLSTPTRRSPTPPLPPAPRLRTIPLPPISPFKFFQKTGTSCRRRAEVRLRGFRIVTRPLSSLELHQVRAHGGVCLIIVAGPVARPHRNGFCLLSAR